MDGCAPWTGAGGSKSLSNARLSLRPFTSPIRYPLKFTLSYHTVTGTRRGRRVRKINLGAGEIRPRNPRVPFKGKLPAACCLQRQLQLVQPQGLVRSPREGCLRDVRRRQPQDPLKHDLSIPSSSVIIKRCPSVLMGFARMTLRKRPSASWVVSNGGVGSTTGPKTHISRSDEKRVPWRNSGTSGPCRNSPPFTPHSTITSTRTVPSTAAIKRNARSLWPSGVSLRPERSGFGRFGDQFALD